MENPEVICFWLALYALFRVLNLCSAIVGSWEMSALIFVRWVPLSSRTSGPSVCTPCISLHIGQAANPEQTSFIPRSTPTSPAAKVWYFRALFKAPDLGRLQIVCQVDQHQVCPSETFSSEELCIGEMLFSWTTKWWCALAVGFCWSSYHLICWQVNNSSDSSISRRKNIKHKCQSNSMTILWNQFSPLLQRFIMFAK